MKDLRAIQKKNLAKALLVLKETEILHEKAADILGFEPEGSIIEGNLQDARDLIIASTGFDVSLLKEHNHYAFYEALLKARDLDDFNFIVDIITNNLMSFEGKVELIVDAFEDISNNPTDTQDLIKASNAFVLSNSKPFGSSQDGV